MKYSEILSENRQVVEIANQDKYSVAIFSNITMNQAKEVFEYHLRNVGIKPRIQLADYNNILQGSVKYSNADCVIIFWEIINLIDGFQYKVLNYSEEQIENLVDDIKREITLFI